MNQRTPAPKPCPCGCGSTLFAYNGQRPLVCYRAWQRVPQPVRACLTLPGAWPAERRQAARRVFELARRIKAERAAQAVNP